MFVLKLNRQPRRKSPQRREASANQNVLNDEASCVSRRGMQRTATDGKSAESLFKSPATRSERHRLGVFPQLAEKVPDNEADNAVSSVACGLSRRHSVEEHLSATPPSRTDSETGGGTAKAENRISAPSRQTLRASFYTQRTSFLRRLGGGCRLLAYKGRLFAN